MSKAASLRNILSTRGPFHLGCFPGRETHVRTSVRRKHCPGHSGWGGQGPGGQARGSGFLTVVCAVKGRGLCPTLQTPQPGKPGKGQGETQGHFSQPPTDRLPQAQRAHHGAASTLRVTSPGSANAWLLIRIFFFSLSPSLLPLFISTPLLQPQTFYSLMTKVAL